MGHHVKDSSANIKNSRRNDSSSARKLLVDATRINVRSRSGRALMERPALVARVMEDVLRRRVVCIMADAGMGKTVLARQLACDAASKGVEALYVELGDGRQDSTLNKLMRCVRSVEARARKTRYMLIVDDVPSWDEGHAFRAAHALGRLAKCDVGVALLGRPSAAAIVDELSAPVALWSCDLVCRESEALLWCPAWKEMPKALLDVSGGIPLLVDALRSAVPTTEVRCLPSAYGRHLGELVSTCLADKIMEEERRLRYAMLVMGSGRTEDLGMIGSKVETCVLEDLERSCPLLGVSVADGRYSVIGATRDEVLRAVGSCDKLSEDEAFDVCARAVMTLANAGNFERMGSACTNLFSKEQASEVVCSWPIELANAGYPELLSLARESKTDARITFGARVALRARAALAGDRKGILRLAELPSGPLTERQQTMVAQVEALEYATGVLPFPGGVCSGRGRASALAQDFELHGRVRQLLREGRFADAYRDLLASSARVMAPSLAGSLLCLDRELVCALVGDEVNSDMASNYDVAYNYLDAHGFSEVFAAMGAGRAVAAMANAQAVDERMLDRAQGYAIRCSDTLTETVALLVAAAHDIRQSMHKRAVVRAELATKRAKESGNDYFAVVATLLQDYATACMDRGMGGVCDFTGAAQDGSPEQAAAWILRQSLGGLSDSGDLRMTLAEMPAPSGLMPLCAFVLGEGMDKDIATALESRMPSSWMSYARRIRCSATRSALESQGRLMVSSGGRTLRRSTRIEAYALGSLRLVVDGNEMCRTSWDRTAARQLFALLVCVEGHEISVREAVEEIWPNADYVAGSRRLYPTVSSLRSCLDDPANDESESVLRRANGKIVLDTSQMYVDVDDFESEARLAVMATHVGSCVRHAVAANKLYAGGLTCAAALGGGMLRQRGARLRALYVDAMVAGAEAELRSGVARRASWFACEAVDADGLREDAVAVALRSLCAANRVGEAVRLYDAYVRRAVEAGGMGATRYIDDIMRDLGVFARSSHGTVADSRTA